MADQDLFETAPTDLQLGASEKPAATIAPDASGDAAGAEAAAAAKAAAAAATVPQVPLPALHEERMRRRELQQQLEEQKRLIDNMERRFQQLTEPRKAPPPDFEENPAAHLKAKLDETEARVEQISQIEGQRAQQNNRLRQIQELSGYVAGNEASYAQHKADYYDAIAHLNAQKRAEYAAAGYGPDALDAMVFQDNLAIAWQAKQAGQNPAEVYYKLAELRGYRAKPAGAAAGAGAAETHLQTIARLAAGTPSLGPSGGGDGDVTLAKLAAMDDDAFEKATQGGAWAKLWGG